MAVDILVSTSGLRHTLPLEDSTILTIYNSSLCTKTSHELHLLSPYAEGGSLQFVFYDRLCFGFKGIPELALNQLPLETAPKGIPVG